MVDFVLVIERVRTLVPLFSMSVFFSILLAYNNFSSPPPKPRSNRNIWQDQLDRDEDPQEDDFHKMLSSFQSLDRRGRRSV